jgi:hypothetical protein
MIEISTTLFLVICAVLGIQLNIYVLVITNLKRKELDQKIAEERQYVAPTDSIHNWQWEEPQE